MLLEEAFGGACIVASFNSIYPSIRNCQTKLAVTYLSLR